MPLELNKCVGNRVGRLHLVNDDVLHSNREALSHEPAVDKLLNRTEELSSRFVAVLSEDQMYEALANRADHLLHKGTLQQLSLLNENVGVPWAAVRILSLFHPLHIEVRD